MVRRVSLILINLFSTKAEPVGLIITTRLSHSSTLTGKEQRYFLFNQDLSVLRNGGFFPF